MTIPNPYFEKVPGIGNLSMEQILEEYDYPLLSVLKDSSGARYLCMCYDTRGAQHWAVVKISVSHLTQLLSNHLQLADAFLRCGHKTVFIRMDYKTREETYLFYEPKDVPLDCIPEKGEFLDAESGDWDEYIQLLHNLDSCEDFIYDYDAELPSCYTPNQNLLEQQHLTMEKASVIWDSRTEPCAFKSNLEVQPDGLFPTNTNTAIAA